MKSIFSHLMLLAVSALAVGRLHAEFNSALVAADSQWVVYADLDALRASAIGKELVSLGEKAQFQTPDGKIGVDVRKVLAMVGTVTAYGPNFARDPKLIEGSLVVQGTADLKKIAIGLLAQATLTKPEVVSDVKDMPFETYAVVGGQGEARGRVFIGFPPENIILVSKSKAQLLHAREVFAGKAPSLAEAASSPLKALLPNAGGATVFAASLVPSDQVIPGDGPQTRVLRMAHSGSVSLGDDGTKTFAHVELLASSDEMADKLMKILQGMTAMMSLAETNDQQLSEFLNSAEVSRQGDTVTLALSYSSARLAQMIQNAVQTQRQNSPAGNRRGVGGKTVAEWPIQAATVDGGPAPEATFVWRTVDGVHLRNGATLTLSANRKGADKGPTFDRIEILPADGQGGPLVFRAPHMRLVGFRVEEAPADSGVQGRVATARGGFNLAQFDFPGEDGIYRLKVHYLATPDAPATLTLAVKDPETPKEPPADDDAGHPDAK